MRQRGWLHFLIPAGCWLEEFSCDRVEWTSRSRRLAPGMSVSYNWWVREGFFAVGSGLKERGILVDNR